MVTISYSQKTSDTKLKRKNAPVPAFCPNPNCVLHHNPAGNSNWFRFRGVLDTARHGKVQKYMCTSCGRSFTETAFLTTYYEKKDVSLDKVLENAHRDISLRQWSEKVGVHPGVLKLRLCKVAVLLVSRVSEKGLMLYTGELIFKLYSLHLSGVCGFRVLRELIVSLKEVLEHVRIGSKENRIFTRDIEQESILYALKMLYCSWQYRMWRDYLFHPLYQLE